MRLQAGQIIRPALGRDLFRVEYVNECRAKVVPLRKRHVTLTDGSEFDANLRGHNISPNSIVEIVTDVDAALTELELQEAERELERAQRSVAAEQAPPPVAKVAPTARREAPRTAGDGWHLAVAAAPSFKAGSLAAEVMTVVVAHPGLTTKEVADRVKSAGNVGACVSRFMQAGYIEKR